MAEQYHKKPQASAYDMIVIGSGPGGQRAAVQAAKLGKTVLLIEKDRMGGSCLHTGTIPSKTLREAALNVSAVPIDVTGANADILRAVMARTRTVIESESAVIEDQLFRNKIDYIGGLATFSGLRQIKIRNAAGTFKAEAPIVVIATGTSPRRPTDVNFDGQTILDSDSVLELDRQPKTMAVLGAGVIGCEYASIYARMGVHVTLIDRKPELLKSIDEEVTAALAKHFAQSNVTLILGADYRNVQTKMRDKKARVSMDLAAKPGEFVEHCFDVVLVCLGRVGNVEHLRLKETGLETNDRGLISVDSNYLTPVSGIYAVGDIIGAPGLAASSSEQGRLAALHAITGEEAQFPSTFPYGIYTIPEISSVGAQESELKLRGIEYVVGRARYDKLARGKILADEHGFLKLLVDKKTEKILGVHVIGTGATELVHIGQTAMAFGATIEFFVDNVFNYPTLAEAYKVAAFNAFNKLHPFQAQAKAPIV